MCDGHSLTCDHSARGHSEGPSCHVSLLCHLTLGRFISELSPKSGLRPWAQFRGQSENTSRCPVEFSQARTCCIACWHREGKDKFESRQEDKASSTLL